MNEQDYSQYIYDKFYPANKPLKITLQNGDILEGELIGCFHGDPNSDDPFVTRWHYVGKGEENLSPIGNGEQGAILEQEDIKTVEFK
jgi:hypothetical protein